MLLNELIKSLTSTLEVIKKFLESDNEKVTVKKRLNQLLLDGNFGARFNKCKFKKQNISFLNIKGLICKELKLIVLFNKLPSDKERICRARRFTVIYLENKYDIKKLEKELVNNELI